MQRLGVEPTGGARASATAQASADPPSQSGGSSGSAVDAYDVGTYNELRKGSVTGDKLDIHHAPQKALAMKTVAGYDSKTGPSIALPKGEHAAVTAAQAVRNFAAGTARDLLAIDIRDLRNLTNAPNGALRSLIDLAKTMYPQAFEE